MNYRIEPQLEKEIESSKKLKLIAISKENYFILQRMGFAGESFNDVLDRILKNNSNLLVESHSIESEVKK